MKKFYGVKVGRRTGVFTSWIECEKQVKGFSGAIFKGFSTKQEAENFIGCTKVSPKFETKLFTSQILKPEVLRDDTIDVYTDGSSTKTKNVENQQHGFGAWTEVFFEDEEPEFREFSFSGKCTFNFVKLHYGIESVKISNPTVEFIAVVEVMKKFMNSQQKRFKRIIFHCDYIGTENWMEGSWKASEDHIKKVLKVANEVRKTLLEMGITIEFVHVKGHSGIRGNEKADALASSYQEVDEFSNLLNNC